MFKYIPNILTIIRLFLVPFFPIAYFSDSPNGHLIALIIFVIAGITDFLDGTIARKYNLTTKLGAVLDPLADKTMLLTAIISLYFGGDLPLIIPIIVVGKELLMVYGGLFVYFRRKKTVIPANNVGKGATILYTLAVFITILFPMSLPSILLLFSAVALKLIAMVVYLKGYYLDIKPTTKD
jgi:cardiolipin synthase